MGPVTEAGIMAVISRRPNRKMMQKDMLPPQHVFFCCIANYDFRSMCILQHPKSDYVQGCAIKRVFRAYLLIKITIRAESHQIYIELDWVNWRL